MLLAVLLRVPARGGVLLANQSNHLPSGTKIQTTQGFAKMYNRCMVIALIISVALNVLLVALLFLQRVKATITAQAMADLLKRVDKLEAIARRPPDKITIVSPNNKET